MYLNNFEYYAPGTAGEALQLIGSLGEQARVLAGGTDLIPMMKDKSISPRYLIDINNVKEFRGLNYEAGKGAVIGTSTKISEIEHSAIIREKYYALQQAAANLGSAQVRFMATIGGNNCHASPAAETPTPLVALGTIVVISSISGERELPLEDFITGNRQTALKAGELLVRFILPEPAPHSASRYMFMGLRDAMEIDAVNMAVNLVLEAESNRIKAMKFVMGSVAPKPIVSAKVPELLVGQEFTNALLEKAAIAAAGEARPISDIRASAEYRQEIVAVLTRRLLREAYNAAQEVQ